MGGEVNELDPKMEIPENGEYARQYSETNFWEKLGAYAKVAGREVVEKALVLFFTAQSPQVPLWARTTIYGALGYFISPFDAIPDVTPLVGFADDLGVLAAALAVVLIHVTPEIEERARSQAARWIGR